LPYAMKSVKPLHGDRTSARRRAPPKRTGSSAESTPKRKRSTQAKAGSVAKKIACVSCGQTDVPLMLGGRKFPQFAHVRWCANVQKDFADLV